MRKLIIFSLLTSFVSFSQESNSEETNNKFEFSSKTIGLLKRIENLEKIHFDCPEGFVLLNNNAKDTTKVNNSKLNCIQKKINNPIFNWVESTQFCFEQFGGRLPTVSEWIYAKDNHIIIVNSSDNEITNTVVREMIGKNISIQYAIVNEKSSNKTPFKYTFVNEEGKFRCFMSR